ncbi:MAG: RsmB/NOP family class I SAM-dependent RNA methyltransferase [Chitinophagaceae bacterium]
MIFDRHFQSALHLLSLYTGDLPLSRFLSQFYNQNPQMGSRDRRNISSLVYHFFRLGHAGKEWSAEERILAGLFLSASGQKELLDHFQPTWKDSYGASLEEKVAFLGSQGYGFRLEDIFPWKQELSAGIDHPAFCRSFLQQPRLFIRATGNRQAQITRILEKEQIPYDCLDEQAIALPNGTPVAALLPDGSWYQVQDYSSQRTLRQIDLNPFRNSQNGGIRLWDCCAGSGGKSLHLMDHYPGLDLWVTDKRASLLRNLEERFRVAGIRHYSSAVLDLCAVKLTVDLPSSFDVIVLDAPCSGSGTWGRTPESLYFFRPEKIPEFRKLQQKIIHQVIPFLKKGGLLLYITCSVFHPENETLIGEISRPLGLTEESGGMMLGYPILADQMFCSALIKT